MIAPTLHCAYKRATENTIVGERSVGDARLDYDALTYGWFDIFLKGEKNGMLDTLPKVRYYTMGINKWQTSDTWPPRGAQPLTFYLSSGGNANTLNGDGVLTTKPPADDKPDTFEYDPMNPVPSYGGNVCCTGNAVTGGAFDQRKMEARPDILVYTTEPLKEGIEVSGPIEVDALRLVGREGHRLHGEADRRVSRTAERTTSTRRSSGCGIATATTSRELDGAGQGVQGHAAADDDEQLLRAGPSIRIEVSSSNFPRFDRNLNTGGKNYDETKGVVAHNACITRSSIRRRSRSRW